VVGCCSQWQRAYVVYPPEGPRPPSGDEIREMVKKNKTVS